MRRLLVLPATNAIAFRRRYSCRKNKNKKKRRKKKTRSRGLLLRLYQYQVLVGIPNGGALRCDMI